MGVLEPGHLFRTVRIPGPVTAAMVLVDPPAWDEWLRRTDCRAFPIRGAPLFDCPELYAATAEYVDKFQRSPALEIDHARLTMMDLLTRRASSLSEGPRREVADTVAVRRAREVLHEHVTDPITLEELASAARVSPFYLSRAFKREVGLPPHAYQTQLRLARARRLLMDGCSPVDAALAVGFSDQSHLTRHLRRSLGVTPGQLIRHRVAANGRAMR